jgi:hypothetical protein
MPFGTSRAQGFGNPVATSFAAGTVRINLSGLFVYSGPPAAGNLVFSLAWLAGTDRYGNPYPSGLNVGLYANPRVVLVAGNPSKVQFPLPNETYTAPPYIAGGESDAGGYLAVYGPQLSGAGQDDYIVFSLWSSNSGTPNSAATGYCTYFDANGGQNTIFFFDYSGLSLYVVKTIAAVKPGTGTSSVVPAVPETWHQATMATDWTGPLNYRLLPDGNIQFQGTVTPTAGATFANGTVIASTGTNYEPVSTHFLTDQQATARYLAFVAGTDHVECSGFTAVGQTCTVEGSIAANF